MNLSNPILICDGSEEFRILLREMLTKNGFFHVLETASSEETMEVLSGEKRNYFIIVESKVLNENLLRELQKQKNFVVLTRPLEEKTFNLAARLGVKHLMSFPFNSEKLIAKINSFN